MEEDQKFNIIMRYDTIIGHRKAAGKIVKKGNVDRHQISRLISEYNGRIEDLHMKSV